MTAQRIIIDETINIDAAARDIEWNLGAAGWYRLYDAVVNHDGGGAFTMQLFRHRGTTNQGYRIESRTATGQLPLFNFLQSRDAPYIDFYCPDGYMTVKIDHCRS